MADVEMTDAPPKTKSSKAGAGGEAEGKKRFEVKKVRDIVLIMQKALDLTNH